MKLQSFTKLNFQCRRMNSWSSSIDDLNLERKVEDDFEHKEYHNTKLSKFFYDHSGYTRWVNYIHFKNITNGEAI